MSSSGLPLRKSVRQPARQPVRREAAARRRRLFLEPLEQRQLLTVIENFPPVGVDDSYSVIENQPLSITAFGLPTPGVLYNDSDPNGDQLTAIHYSGPGSGTLALNADGSFTYTPNSDYVGSDSFTYQAYDGALATGLINVSLTIEAAANQAPVGVADDYTLDENGSLSVSASGVLGNDTDADNDPLTASLISGPANGTLSLSADGSFTYTPNADFDGTDSFTYKANDGEDDSSETTVTITVTPTNHAPTANDGSTSILHDHFFSSSVSGSDLDNDALTYSAGGVSNVTLTFNSDGSFTYMPSAGYVGTDSFSFTVSDGAASDTGTYTIAIENNAPTAYDGSTGVLHDHSFSAAISGYDPDGDPLTYSFGSPAHGTLTFIDGSNFTYTPAEHFVGNDSFTFIVSDGVVPVSGTFTINVYNTAPTAYNSSASVVHDRTLSSWVSGGYDYDGDPITYIAAGASNGEVSMNGDGSYTFTPSLGYAGPASFNFLVSDGIDSTSGTVTIDVTNSTPTIWGDPISVRHDQAASAWAYGYDSDGDSLTYSASGATLRRYPF